MEYSQHPLDGCVNEEFRNTVTLWGIRTKIYWVLTETFHTSRRVAVHFATERKRIIIYSLSESIDLNRVGVNGKSYKTDHDNGQVLEGLHCRWEFREGREYRRFKETV
jgi:hypothetical protein